jgi:hypothetical protein
MHSYYFPCVLHALPISFPLTLSCYLYFEKSTSYEDPHAVFSNHPSLDRLWLNYSPQQPVLKHSVNIPPLLSGTKFCTHTEPQAKLCFCIVRIFRFETADERTKCCALIGSKSHRKPLVHLISYVGTNERDGRK